MGMWPSSLARHLFHRRRWRSPRCTAPLVFTAPRACLHRPHGLHIPVLLVRWRAVHLSLLPDWLQPDYVREFQVGGVGMGPLALLVAGWCLLLVCHNSSVLCWPRATAAECVCDRCVAVAGVGARQWHRKETEMSSGWLWRVLGLQQCADDALPPAPCCCRAQVQPREPTKPV